MNFDKRRTKYHGIIRALSVLVVFVLQIVFVGILAQVIQQYAVQIYFAVEILSVMLVFALVNDTDYNQQFWIVILLLMPGFGFVLYFFWGSKRRNSALNKNIRRIESEMCKRLTQDSVVMEEFAKIHPNKIQIARYLEKEGYPLYKNTRVKYYPLGDDMEKEFLHDLEKAKKYIFMEYFIVYNGDWWQRIVKILQKKVKEGVEVRLLIDDFGCLMMDVRNLKKDLRNKGIQICSFGPIDRRITAMSFNYRNHQKITVIDGSVGYTGGINLADEYINKIVRFGHWKDTAVRLQGEAVWSLTNIFLEMWEESSQKKDKNPMEYTPREIPAEDSFVQPFAGGPHRNPNNPVEGVYSRMINKARDYVYITTPYLVLDGKLLDNLIQAAQSGVDVRIITPHIYDKWYVYMVNISNYGKLVQNGVRVYEYTPGFIHAKNMISDDECAVCGTINLDYRSLYIHYENGVLLSENEAVLKMRDDFMETLEQCEEIHYTEWKKRPIHQKIVQWILRLYSPLL